MGCGASSSKGSAPSGQSPKAATPGTAAQPTTSKQPSDLSPAKETASSVNPKSAATTPQPAAPTPPPATPTPPQRASSSDSQKAAAAAAPSVAAPAASPSPPAPPVPASTAAPEENQAPKPPSRPASAAAAPAPPSRPASAAAAGPAPPSRPGSTSAAGPAPIGTSQTRLPPLPAGSSAMLVPPTKTSSRPALQVPRLVAGAPVSCLTPPPPLASGPLGSPTASDLPAGTAEQVQQLASGGGGAAGQVAAAAHVRQLLCVARPPVQALLDAGAAAALVRCLQEGPQEAKLDAAWALTNIAASADYSHVEAICNAEAPIALLAALGLGAGTTAPTHGSQTHGSRTTSGASLAPLLATAAGGESSSSRPGSADATAPGGGGGGGGSGSGAAVVAAAAAAVAAAAVPVSPAAAALREQALWGLANIAGAINPEYKTQALATEVLDVGALGPVIAILEAEAATAAASSSRSVSRSGSGTAGSGSRSGPINPTLRCAAWCLHNLAKHKREKEMVDVIPLATRLLLSSCPDVEVLTCCAWVLAYLGSNEDNKSHLKQALPALPRLVPWVREAASTLATPALLCVGTMCTGYMRSLDYSGEVVEAGGVPAFLSYLRKGSEAGRRDMVTEALFALSNVAGANNATVRAMLEAGAFTDVMSLLRTAGDDEEIRMECLYVLTNAWDPLVAAEVATVQKMLEVGVLEELDRQLEASAPAERLDLLLKGLTDGLKRGQTVMTYTASMMLVELGREEAAKAPAPTNPVVDLYVKLGTVDRIQALNSHPHAEVATKANGILTVLKFMS